MDSSSLDDIPFLFADIYLQVTANALRQQVMNREARRLEKEIKEVGHCFLLITSE